MIAEICLCVNSDLNYIIRETTRITISIYWRSVPNGLLSLYCLEMAFIQLYGLLRLVMYMPLLWIMMDYHGEMRKAQRMCKL